MLAKEIIDPRYKRFETFDLRVPKKKIHFLKAIKINLNIYRSKEGEKERNWLNLPWENLFLVNQRSSH